MNPCTYKILFTIIDSDGIHSDLSGDMSFEEAYEMYNQFLSEKENLQFMMILEIDDGKVREVGSIGELNIERHIQAMKLIEELEDM